MIKEIKKWLGIGRRGSDGKDGRAVAWGKGIAVAGRGGKGGKDGRGGDGGSAVVIGKGKAVGGDGGDAYREAAFRASEAAYKAGVPSRPPETGQEKRQFPAPEREGGEG